MAVRKKFTIRPREVMLPHQTPMVRGWAASTGGGVSVPVHCRE